MTVNRTSILGTVYLAVDAGRKPCEGCAGKCGNELCQLLPPCSSDQREDWREVVWVESKGEKCST